MLKYSYEFKYLVPYINAGLIYTYNFSNENVYTQKEMDFTMDKTRFVELVSNNRFGYIAGFGVAKKINYASSVFIEIRYSSQGNFLSKSVDGDYLSKKDLGVVFGFNF
jgi:outer membrane protein W